jgi:hypothetical protein
MKSGVALNLTPVRSEKYLIKIFCNMKNCYNFAAFKTKRTKHNISCDGIFYARLDACVCKDKEAVQIPAAVIEICQFFWSRMGGEQPFLFT